MAIIVAIFIILTLYDLPRFIRNKEKARVYVIYGFLMGISLTVSLLMEANKTPPGPARWTEWIFKMLGVVK